MNKGPFETLIIPKPGGDPVTSGGQQQAVKSGAGQPFIKGTTDVNDDLPTWIRQQNPETNNVQTSAVFSASVTPVRECVDGLPPLPIISKSSLLDLASPLISLALELKATLNFTNIAALKLSLIFEIERFEEHIKLLKLNSEQVKLASFGLSCYLDECFQNSAWGLRCNWRHESLLIDNAKSGSQFFEKIEDLVRQPAENIKLIEFYYVLLSLGFKGKYLTPEFRDKSEELEMKRTQLYQFIQNTIGDTTQDLSPNWRGQQSQGLTLSRKLPVWVFVSVAFSFLCLSYFGFLYAINNYSNPVYKDLLMLSSESIPFVESNDVDTPRLSLVHKVSLERFKPLLKEEILNNMVEVVDDRILRIRNSFLSGSDQIKPEFATMLQKIAKELENGQDSVIVTGHTDDKPIISTKFPTNWHLSVARAENVKAFLASHAHLLGIRAEGRADGEPLVANDTPEHRALNRRVDILVK